MTRRRIPVPPLRRSMLDFLYLAGRMPLVTVERRMRLGPLVAARAACAARPSWVAMFTKAFALVAKRHPELRRVYCALPWPHFYEHGGSVGLFSVEREVDGLPTVLFGHRKNPDQSSLEELNAYVRACQDGPLERLKMYRRMRRMAPLPFFARRFLWRGVQMVGGPLAVDFLGTFGLSSVGGDGAGMVTILSVTPSTLHFGRLDAAGGLDFRLTFDHRVYDGAFAARVLAELEGVLLTEILAEVQMLGSQGK